MNYIVAIKTFGSAPVTIHTESQVSFVGAKEAARDYIGNILAKGSIVTWSITQNGETLEDGFGMGGFCRLRKDMPRRWIYHKYFYKKEA